jgi:hypothetical protein
VPKPEPSPEYVDMMLARDTEPTFDDSPGVRLARQMLKKDVKAFWNLLQEHAKRYEERCDKWALEERKLQGKRGPEVKDEGTAQALKTLDEWLKEQRKRA